MSKTKLEIIEIAKCGADLVISAKTLTKLEIIEIFEHIQSNAKVSLIDTDGKTKLELIEIIKAAPKGRFTLHV